jgi:hypothetical protein
MNKERYNQIINETYTNYFNETNNWSKGGPHNIKFDELKMIGTLSGPISRAKIRQYTKEEFTNMCKTNSEFSKKWGLKIEERELSFEERMRVINIPEENIDYILNSSNFKEIDVESEGNIFLNYMKAPTKLITLTYNNEIIESYE